MSIFKGDSIYKSGAGGAGYKDGGALVDGDFIKVENNTVSSYDNVSRDPINLYFETKDGEVLNAIVELTTAVNSTVNVYVVKNGFYYLLGNVGGNTVNSGDDYKVNITGDSFAIELVQGGGNTPEFVELMGAIYGLIKVNNLLWLNKNFEGNIGTYYKQNGTTYYLYDTVKDINIDGWRLPMQNVGGKNEINDLTTFTTNQLKSVSGWNNSSGNGNNHSGFNARPYGYLDADNMLQSNTYIASFLFISNYQYGGALSLSDTTTSSNGSNMIKRNLRLVYEL